MSNYEKLHLGTSGWSYKDWSEAFYPVGLKASNYLSYYSKYFRTVEVDSTFYGIPRGQTMQRWYNQTPDDFIFTLKVPKMITHEKGLLASQSEWRQFLLAVERLGRKSGPLILQFDYKFRFEDQFQNLANFLKLRRQESNRIAVEIRHRSWHRREFYDLLTECDVALVLHDLYYMPRIAVTTTDFTIIRLLGNRKQIPADFSHVRIDREADLNWWDEKIRDLLGKNLEVYVYANNRYQGHAPSTIRSLADLLGVPDNF